MTITRLQAGPRMSQAVIHGATIYLAGQVADQAKGKSVGEQTKEILATIDGLLAEAGSDKTRILSATIYLADIGDVRRNERGVGRVGSAPAMRPRARLSRPSSPRRPTPSRSPASRPRLSRTGAAAGPRRRLRFHL